MSLPLFFPPPGDLNCSEDLDFFLLGVRKLDIAGSGDADGEGNTVSKDWLVFFCLDRVLFFFLLIRLFCLPEVAVAVSEFEWM